MRAMNKTRCASCMPHLTLEVHSLNKDAADALDVGGKIQIE